MFAKCQILLGMRQKEHEGLQKFAVNPGHKFLYKALTSLNHLVMAVGKKVRLCLFFDTIDF